MTSHRLDRIATTLDDIATTLDEIKEGQIVPNPEVLDRIRLSMERAARAIDRLENRDAEFDRNRSS